MVISANNVSKNCIEFSNLIDLARYRAEHQPEDTAYSFLVDGENEEVSLTYFEWERRVRAIAFQLQCLGVKGERVLLLYPPGLEYSIAFFGCLYAGVVAVPAYPPRNNRSLGRIQAIVKDAQASVALTNTSLLSNLEQWFALTPELTSLQLLATDNLDWNLADEWRTPTCDQSTLAFLQYTSGSTSAPKGVMVSHGNLLHNSKLIYQYFRHTPNSQGVIWLPPYHDMGLIGGIIQPLYGGFPTALIPPMAFLQNPFRWLQAISRYQGTTSGGPNFAYDLCVQKATPEKLANLDLSSWKLAFTGAEPIREQTLKRFADTFAPCGFRYEAFYPCYGLAEGTLFVTGGLKDAPPVIHSVQGVALEQNRVVAAAPEEEGSRTLVGCGQVPEEVKVVIVERESLNPCADGEVGEIWVSSASVAQGYWNRVEQTEFTFQARLGVSEETGEINRFLRTGDLGFMLNGELFVTGRLKDLIIIRGRNHYPQDIEQTVEKSHSALQPGSGAAFAVAVAGEEQLAIAFEVERTSLRKLNVSEVVGAIRRAIAEHHDLQVYAIVLLKTGSIPKTSSGKIQRHACLAAFLDGSLDVVGEWRQEGGQGGQGGQGDKERRGVINRSRMAIQDWLVSQISQRLNLAFHQIDIKESFACYGLDSVAAVRLTGDLAECLECQLEPTLLYDYPNIESLAEYLGEKPNLKKSIAPSVSEKPVREPIAIVGMSSCFPGANYLDAYWELLRYQKDAIVEVPANRWDVNSFYHPRPATPGKMSSRWGGFLAQVDQFDPQFFGISPREAERMDPQQRLLMKVAWEALENAAIPAEKLAGSLSGVFIGISTSDYWRLQTTNIDAYAGTGNAHSIAANRLSYFFDFIGPSLAVDTACSSSLVAAHLACQSLRSGECNLALVGGVNLILSPDLTIAFSQARMMAADGRCKTFDASADGYVRSEGCGVVVLKRLSDALRDGDNILATIRGSAINQDGHSNGLTAPNGLSQQAVIRQALENAGVTPDQISYVEAHGTGTPLGDPIEINSLKAVLSKGRSLNQPCAIGSVKTNIGHLEAAAGIAGLIKVALALYHREIPAHLNLKQLNPHISLENTPFFIPTEHQPWNSVNNSLFAGVSSFGFGGTNAHVVLEESFVISH
ncbi:MAG: beta-ketoacyl synthase N-terminal-like domain-containing protein [Nostoc sp. ChiQUE02]|uniref:beta-ketoacyl synthase N-terminal-like domain-containing protein n=1 Tax=Nostoc sp. ChiQUE02 TaxID=3075377 RepID=UPI002AD59CD3|nr:beta-ketoacyl synthase N-terminal-like domain-containing protein [Nostoc sp. ChiQUE02]MDZ8231416.1 beta-ketoacyl synthase N-terminal-like domain-containing protein [Nostoc sp. ChiQUE02]